MFRRILLIAALFVVLPLTAAANDDASAPLAVTETTETESHTEVTETAAATSSIAVDTAPPALFVADFREVTNNRNACSRPSCNYDFQCGWMRAQCALHTYPACNGGTGNGCQGECVCACS